MNVNVSPLRAFIVELAETNYFNEKQRIIRIKFGSRYYEFHLASSTFEVPHPNRHLILLITTEQVLDKEGIDISRSNYPPGIADETGSLRDINIGIGFLIDRNQKVSGTYPQSGSAAFAMTANMFDPDQVRVSMSPAGSKDYTNKEPELQDTKYQNIGLFINDDAVLIKSRGGAITISDNGIHFGGNIYWESANHSKEFMMDNQFHGFIPSTIFTPTIALPYFPNFDKVLQLSQAGIKVIEVTNKAATVGRIFT